MALDERIYSIEPDMHGDGWFLPAPDCADGCRAIDHQATRTVPGVAEGERLPACRCHRVRDDCADDEHGYMVQVSSAFWWHIMKPCRVTG